MGKAKKAIKKPPKKRANKYEAKLLVNGTPDDIFNAMIKPKVSKK